MFVSELKIVVFELNNFFVDLRGAVGASPEGEKGQIKSRQHIISRSRTRGIAENNRARRLINADLYLRRENFHNGTPVDRVPFHYLGASSPTRRRPGGGASRFLT